MPAIRSAVFTTALVVHSALVSPLAAQCAPTWSGDPLPYVRGSVTATAYWDPDGAGPLPQSLVVGGSIAVGESNTSIAYWTGSEWHAMDAPGEVLALTVWNGQLVAGSAQSIARWNGSSWQTLGVPYGSGPFYFPAVRSLAVYGGRLFAGGHFTAIDNIAVEGLASFDGLSWSQVGTGLVGTTYALTAYDNKLYVGGTLQPIGLTSPNLVAWNGNAWVATPGASGTVTTMAVQFSFFDAGQLFVGGTFSTFGSFAAARIARYTAGTGTWSAVAGGLPGACIALATNGGITFGTDLIAAVDQPGNTVKVWRWNGTTWSAMAQVTDQLGEAMPTCVAFFGSPILGLTSAATALRSFANATWTPLRGTGVPDFLLAVDANGSDVVIGGSFTTVNGTTMNGIARGTHAAWQPLGTGLAGPCNAIARAPNGDLYAGGSFASAGGNAANNVARWNGSAWAPLGTGTNGPVQALRVLADGSLIAAGSFTTAGGTAANRIARWNGTAWSALGTGFSGPCNALAVAANGDIYAGGAFLQAGSVVCNRIARWNGTTWNACGSGVDGTVYALAVRTDGALAAGGAFQNAGGVSAPYAALWSAGAWSSLWTLGRHPLSSVTSLTALPDGDLVACGGRWVAPASWPFAAIDTCVMRHDGQQWRTLQVVGNSISAASLAPNGELVFAGDIALTAGIPHGNLARMVPSCPATAVSYGAGCSGSGGPNVLTATALPWLGGTFRGVATGMPNSGFAVVGTGFQSLAIPIAALAPQGLPGCTSLLLSTAIEIVFPVAGRVETAFAVPADPSLLGLQVRQQVAPFETNQLGAVTAITATNGLLLTLGML